MENRILVVDNEQDFLESVERSTRQSRLTAKPTRLPARAAQQWRAGGGQAIINLSGVARRAKTDQQSKSEAHEFRR